MAAELTAMLGFKVTRSMLRRYLKKLGYTWKRFRKSLKKKQSPKEYKEKLVQLKQLIELYNTGFIDLFFADESGFNMEGYLPYGWQPKNEYIKITPSKTRSTQVFGLLSLDNRLEAYSCKGSVTSDVVIAFIDDFNSTRKQPTAIVIDNAPIHHSKKFEAKIVEWEKQDLYIFFLPTYSPHLNPIEILWRFIKYQWLPFERLTSQEELDEALVEIINNFGSDNTINFKELKKNRSVDYL